MAWLRPTLWMAASLVLGGGAAGIDEPRDASESTGRLIEELERGDRSSRVEAAKGLGAMAGAAGAAEPALVEALGDPAGAVRLQASLALWRLDRSRELALPVLLSARSDPDEGVHREAEHAWKGIGPGVRAALTYARESITSQAMRGGTGSSTTAATIAESGLEAMPALLDLLARTEPVNQGGALPPLPGTRIVYQGGFGGADRGLRELALAAIGRIGMRAVPTLIEVMSGRSATLREAAANTFGRIDGGVAEAATTLIRTLEDRDASVRRQAVEVLGRTGMKIPGVPEALIAAVGHLDPAVRLGAVSALGSGRPRDIGLVDALGPALEDPSSRVRLVAAGALARLEPPASGSLDVLVRALEDREPGIREAAVETLESLGERAGSAAPALRGLLDRPDDPIARVLAARALAAVRPGEADRALAALSELTLSADLHARIEAAGVLCDLGRFDEAIPVLLPATAAQAGNLGNRAGQILQEIGPGDRRAVPALLESMRMGDSNARRQALSVLQRIGPMAAEAAPTLILLLSDPDPNTQSIALSILQQIGPIPDEAIPVLVEALKRSDNRNRDQLIRFVAGLGARARPAIPVLVELLGYSDRQVRAQAVNGLQQLAPYGGAEAASALAEAAGDDDPNVRSQAMDGLGKLAPEGRPAAVPALIDVLESAEPANRGAAIGVLQGYGPDGRPAIPALVGLLGDRQFTNPAAQALDAMGPAGEDAAIPALVELLGRAGSEDRIEALHGLRHFFHGSAGPLRAVLPALLEAVADDDAAVRLAAIGVLRASGPLDDREIVDALAEALEDPNADVRLLAAQVLTYQGDGSRDDALLATLLGLLDESDTEIRSRAADLLGYLGPRAAEAVPELVALLDDRDPMVRVSIAGAMGRMGPEGQAAAMPVLARVLTEGDDPEVKNQVISKLNYLGLLEKDALLPSLIALLGESDGRLRYRAIEALGAMGPRARGAIPALADSLREATDQNRQNYRYQTIGALVRIGPKGSEAAVDYLKEALDSADDGKRSEAAGLVRQLDDDSARSVVPALVALLDDHEEHVRHQAALALVGLETELEAARHVLVAMLEDDNNSTRTRGAEALRTIDAEGKRAAIETSMAVMEGASGMYDRLQGARVLMAIGGEHREAALPLVIEQLGTPQQRNTALSILDGSDLEGFAADVVPALIPLIDSGNSGNREQIYRLVGRFGPEAEPATSALIAVLPFERSSNYADAVADALIAIGPSVVSPLRAELREGKGDSIRIIEVLGRLGPEARGAVPELVVALGDTTETTREAAKDALRQIGRGAVAPLIEALECEDATVRRHAASTLGEFGPDGRDAVPGLVEVLEDPSRGVRFASATAIGKIDPGDLGEAVPVLAEVLREGLRNQRRNAARVLERLDRVPEAAVSALEGALGDEDWAVRVHAAGAIGRVEGHAEEAVATLIRALKHRSFTTSTINALDRLGPRAIAALPSLIDFLKFGGETDDMIRAAYTAARIGEQGAIGPLRELLDEIDPRFRPLVVVGLSEVDGGSIETLVELLENHEDPSVREMAARQVGLEALKDQGLQEALVRALDDEAPAVRIAAIQAIGHLDDKALDQRDRLERFLGDPNPTIRAEAAVALSRIDRDLSESTVEVLKAASIGSDFPGRWGGGKWRVIAALGRVGSSAILELIEALKTEGAPRYAAAEAIGRLGPEAREAIPALVGALGDRSWPARARVALALWRVEGRPEDALPALIAALETPELRPRSGARLLFLLPARLSMVRNSTSPERARVHMHTVYPASESFFVPVVDLVDLRLEIVEALEQMGPSAGEARPALEAIAEDRDDPARVAAAEALDAINVKGDPEAVDP